MEERFNAKTFLAMGLGPGHVAVKAKFAEVQRKHKTYVQKIGRDAKKTAKEQLEVSMLTEGLDAVSMDASRDGDEDLNEADLED
jgi:hypothetical protein